MNKRSIVEITGVGRMKIEFRSVYFLGKQNDQHTDLEFLHKRSEKIRTSPAATNVIMTSAGVLVIAYMLPFFLKNGPDLDALSGAFAIIGASLLWLDTNSSDRSLVGILWPEIMDTSKSRFWSLFLSCILISVQIIVAATIFFTIIILMFNYIPNSGSDQSRFINKNFRTILVFLLVFVTVHVLQRVKRRVSLHYEKLISLFRREINKIKQSSTHSLWKAARLVEAMRAGIRSLGLLFLVGSGLMVVVEHMLDGLLHQSNLINSTVLWLRSFNAYKDGSI